jgi:hypothetical protein
VVELRSDVFFGFFARLNLAKFARESTLYLEEKNSHGDDEHIASR